MENNNTRASHWFFNVLEIKLGESSVLGENYVVFYVIHGVAMSLIITSLLSCAVVILLILWEVWKNSLKVNNRQLRMDFADRFPFYLAVADGLWSISHLIDHFYLITTHRFPSNPNISNFLSINLWTFLGYQQLMHAGLAVYTYLRVVRGVEVNLGKGDWKLHGLCAILISTSIAIFYPLNAFGPSGYWMLQDVRTTGGVLLGWYITTSATVQALCTTLGYRQIKKVVDQQKSALMRHYKGEKGTERYSTGSECLTTFVAIALALYCPLALVYCAFVVQSMFGLIEPVTALLIVISANSSGFANAIGYFYNLKVKSIRERMKVERMAMITTSTGSNNSSNNSQSNSNAKHYKP